MASSMIDAPAASATVVTPSDSVNFPLEAKGLFIGGAVVTGIYDGGMAGTPVCIGNYNAGNFAMNGEMQRLSYKFTYPTNPDMTTASSGGF